MMDNEQRTGVIPESISRGLDKAGVVVGATLVVTGAVAAAPVSIAIGAGALAFHAWSMKRSNAEKETVFDKVDNELAIMIGESEELSRKYSLTLDEVRGELDELDQESYEYSPADYSSCGCDCRHHIQ